MTYAKSGEWLATGVAGTGGCEIDVYRWTRSSWVRNGLVEGVPCHGSDAGPGGGYGGGITAEWLTGSAAPDFGVHTSGADDNAFTLVSNIGGIWHLVRFDYGYAPTSDVNFVAMRGRLVETMVNACGCAGGPDTYLWESYRDGIFEPTAPPGSSPRCNNAALEDGGGTPMSQFGPAQPSSVVRKTRYVLTACADGWALGIGDRPGTAHEVVDLFNQDGARWRTVTFDNAGVLGLDPGIYDLTYPLLLLLAARLGPSLQPAAASGVVYMELNPTASSNNWTLSGVMNADNSNWLLATEYQSNSPQPGPHVPRPMMGHRSRRDRSAHGSSTCSVES